MPAAVMLAPLAAQGIGALVGHFAGKKATAAAQKRSPEEAAALTGASGAAASTGKAGSSLLDESRPYLSKPAGYYQTLLSGNRAAMSQATAAPRAQIQEQYRGAETGLGRSGIRGAAKDVLAGQLGRQKAGQVAGLTTGVQPAAANALGSLGTNMMQTAGPLMATSGNIYGNLLGEGARNRMYARGEGEKTGKAIGQLTGMVGQTVQNGMGGNNSSWGNFGKFGGVDTGDYTQASNF